MTLCLVEREQAVRAMIAQARLYRANWRRSSFQLVTTIAAFAASLLLIGSLSHINWWMPIPAAFPAAGLLVRLFIFQHDCGHGSFFRSRRTNDMVGRALGVLTLTPYGAWKRDHATHHASSGNLDRRGHGDVTLLTVTEYSALPPLKRLGYRLYRSPFIMVLLGAPINFIVLQRFAVGQSFHKPAARRSILALNIALVVAFGLPTLLLGPVLVLMTYLPVMVIASWIGNWLFYVQHQFENVYWERADTWDFHAAALGGASYFKLPRILQWFSGNIGLHHVHHLCSSIPNYHLQAYLDANVALTRFTKTISLRQSFGCWKLALWDEVSSQLVTFAAATRH